MSQNERLYQLTKCHSGAHPARPSLCRTTKGPVVWMDMEEADLHNRSLAALAEEWRWVTVPEWKRTLLDGCPDALRLKNGHMRRLDGGRVREAARVEMIEDLAELVLIWWDLRH